MSYVSETNHNGRLSVTGPGYVGLPMAVASAAAGNTVVAFDISVRRVEELRSGHNLST